MRVLTTKTKSPLILLPVFTLIQKGTDVCGCTRSVTNEESIVEDMKVEGTG